MFIWLLPSKRDRKSGRKEASKQAKGASSLATGERIIRKTFQLQYIKNTNLKNMLKGLSVGKTFTTTVRQVTPFYDWQTSFPHSAVRANAAAPEPKAVTEGKEGGGGEREKAWRFVSASSVCVQLNSHSHICMCREAAAAIFTWRTKVCNNFFNQAQHRLPKRSRV